MPVPQLVVSKLYIKMKLQSETTGALEGFMSNILNLTCGVLCIFLRKWE